MCILRIPLAEFKLVVPLAVTSTPLQGNPNDKGSKIGTAMSKVDNTNMRQADLQTQPGP